MARRVCDLCGETGSTLRSPDLWKTDRLCAYCDHLKREMLRRVWIVIAIVAVAVGVFVLVMAGS